MAEEKRRRGRPRKVQVELPSEVVQIIEEVKKKELDAEIQEMHELVEEELKRRNELQYEWDYPIEKTPDFFDASKSYEITGYKPINNTRGLDFKPEWFTEVRENFKRTGHYSAYQRGTKAYVDFWTQEYKRCRDGMTVNGYTITGDNYFFLNYYQLANLDTTKLGEGRMLDFPNFYVVQYEWFHYLELAKRLRKNAVLMKARGVGQH